MSGSICIFLLKYSLYNLCLYCRPFYNNISIKNSELIGYKVVLIFQSNAWKHKLIQYFNTDYSLSCVTTSLIMSLHFVPMNPMLHLVRLIWLTENKKCLYKNTKLQKGENAEFMLTFRKMVDQYDKNFNGTWRLECINNKASGPSLRRTEWQFWRYL
jgi:hypothetical protein